MAHHQSARKALRQTRRQTLVNRMRVSRIRTFVRKLEHAVLNMTKAAGASESHTARDELKVAFVQAQSEIMRGVTKGVIHRNTAARKVSRLAARVRKISS